VSEERPWMVNIKERRHGFYVGLARTVHIHHIIGDFPAKIPCIHRMYLDLANPDAMKLTL